MQSGGGKVCVDRQARGGEGAVLRSEDFIEALCSCNVVPDSIVPLLSLKHPVL